MGMIDTEGTFIGTIKGTALGVTKKSQYPQVVIDLAAVKKYVESKADIEHFKAAGLELDGPTWVDWSDYNETITAYLVLFKSAEEFSKDTALLNYDQLQLATGWDGTEFDSLTNQSLVGKNILFRVETNTFDGKTSLQVSWIDNEQASPERVLKSVDDATVKLLNSKLKMKKAAAPAKPAVAAKAIIKPPVVAAPANPTLASPPTVEATAPAAVTKPPKGKKVKVEEAAPVATNLKGLPAEVSQLDAWTYLCTNKGANEDKIVEEAWLSAIGEVGEGKKDEESFTPAEWGKVRDIVLKDIGIAA